MNHACVMCVLFSQLSAYSFVSLPAEIYSFGSNYVQLELLVVVLLTIVVNYGVLPVFYTNNIDNCYAVN